jgi:glycerol-3-phosphate acyltransferase PlsX
MSSNTIVLDAMSGDYGMDAVVPAAKKVLARHSHISLILVGDEAQLKASCLKYKLKESDRLRIHHASQVVAMTDLPAYALKYKKDSSMRVAINLVKKGEAQACVSAGNTGALMATAHFVLKSLPGISRPAMIRLLPGVKNVRFLDLGANVDSQAEQLEQFAVMGSILAAAVDQIEQPKVALLNVGEEAFKGNEQVKKTAALLSTNKAINYVGFIEGNGIFKGKVDVIVCDGFVGNIAVKAMEGLMSFVKNLIKQTFQESWLTKLLGLPAVLVLRALSKKIDPSAYNGASFLGLRGIVVKSHGSANAKGFETAIERAVSEVHYNVPALIEEQIKKLLEKTV